MLNGINVSGLSEFVQEVKDDKKQSVANYNLSVNWLSGTKSIAKTEGLVLGGHKISRNFTWGIDEPRQILGTNHNPTPQELLLSGVAGCILVSYVMGASVKNIAIESLNIEIEGQLDLRGFLNIECDSPVGFEFIKYKANIRAEAKASDLLALHSMVLKKSPNLMTIAQATAIEGELLIL